MKKIVLLTSVLTAFAYSQPYTQSEVAQAIVSLGTESPAFETLGDIYLNGYRVPVDREKALGFYRMVKTPSSRQLLLVESSHPETIDSSLALSVLSGMEENERAQYWDLELFHLALTDQITPALFKSTLDKHPERPISNYVHQAMVAWYRGKQDYQAAYQELVKFELDEPVFISKEALLSEWLSPKLLSLPLSGMTKHKLIKVMVEFGYDLDEANEQTSLLTFRPLSGEKHSIGGFIAEVHNEVVSGISVIFSHADSYAAAVARIKTKFGLATLSSSGNAPEIQWNKYGYLVVTPVQPEGVLCSEVSGIGRSVKVRKVGKVNQMRCLSDRKRIPKLWLKYHFPIPKQNKQDAVSATLDF